VNTTAVHLSLDDHEVIAHVIKRERRFKIKYKQERTNKCIWTVHETTHRQILGRILFAGVTNFVKLRATS